MTKEETAYQRKLIGKLQRMFPGCYIFINDPARLQGVPDLLILFGMDWAMLEVKASQDAPMRPNQDYYVDQFHHMSFAAFIYPENETEVLSALQSTLGSRR